jgi:hypothetical protein
MSCQIKIRKEMEGMQIEIPRSAFFLLNDDNKGLGIGDWGLGIGPIPNPQSPIPNRKIKIL